MDYAASSYVYAPSYTDGFNYEKWIQHHNENMYRMKQELFIADHFKCTNPFTTRIHEPIKISKEERKRLRKELEMKQRTRYEEFMRQEEKAARRRKEELFEIEQEAKRCREMIKLEFQREREKLVAEYDDIENEEVKSDNFIQGPTSAVSVDVSCKFLPFNNQLSEPVPVLSPNDHEENEFKCDHDPVSYLATLDHELDNLESQLPDDHFYSGTEHHVYSKKYELIIIDDLSETVSLMDPRVNDSSSYYYDTTTPRRFDITPVNEEVSFYWNHQLLFMSTARWRQWDPGGQVNVHSSFHPI